MKDDTTDRALRILDTWLTFEALSPQTIPTDDDLKALRRQAVRAEERTHIPWRNPRYDRTEKEKAVYWMVYLLPIDLPQAFKSILALFPDDQAEERVQAKGQSATAAIVLDEKGRPVPGSDASWLSPSPP